MGVFLAGVFEGVSGCVEGCRGCVPCGCVGGCRWARLGLGADCCLRLNGGQEAKPAQQCPPPGSRGRYSHSWTTVGPYHPLPLPDPSVCHIVWWASMCTDVFLVLACSSLRSAHTAIEKAICTDFAANVWHITISVNKQKIDATWPLVR